jgi:DNA-binding NarL/FixJ family response regulator
VLPVADLAGARTFMPNVNELLRRRSGLETTAGKSQALRVPLAGKEGPSIRGAPAVTGAVLRLLPLLPGPFAVSGMAAQMLLSRNAIKSQANATYRKLDATTRSQAVPRSHDLSLPCR